MQTVNAVIPAGVVSRDVQLDGICEGNLTVAPHVNLQLNGVVAGDLVVAYGATVEMDGMVVGDLINQGGNVMVRGIVQGSVINAAGMFTVIDCQAIINNCR